ncbi:MAG: SulP family inorganic anion transporter, partial [Acidimicrobiaceae bacterium]|nr:SulP family inorganic anion transporter [Acidimicrobiaceae bacterium]
GILIKIGFNIIDWRYLAHIHRVPRENVVVLALTLVLSIVSDLVIAVAVGLVMAALTGARQVERLELDKVISTPLLDMTFLADPEADADAFDLDDDADPFAARVGLLSLRGSFTSASSTRLFKTINHDMAEHEVVIFDFTDTVHVDDSAALAIGQLADTARDSDTQCIVLGMSGMIDTSVHALNVLREIPEENFVENLDEARVVARRLLDD